MSLQSLEAALSQAAARIRPGQSHYTSLFGEDGVTPTQRLPHWLTDPVRTEIESTPELVGFSQSWIQSAGSGHRLSSWSVASALVYLLFAGLQPAQIVSDIADLAQSTVCDTWIYVGLYAGGISDKIELGEGVSVMPATMAPPSFARELVFGVNRWGSQILEKGFSRWSPNAALMIAQPMEIFSENVGSALLSSIGEKIKRAIRSLTLASEHAFVRSQQISWVTHPAIPYEGFGSWGGGGPFVTIPHPRQAGPVNPDLAKRIYVGLKSLSPKIRPPIELAIDRLRRSRTHAPSADTALDLGIASEIILMHEVDKSSELSYRFSLQGAYLLGTDGRDRLAKFHSFKALYKARSQAAHTGTLKMEMQSRLIEFDLLCSAAIRAVVEAQDFPNWQCVTLGVDEKSAQEKKPQV